MEQNTRAVLPHYLWWLIACLAIGVIAAAAYKVYRQSAPPPGEQRVALDPTCDLHSGPCTLSGPDGVAVTLDVSPRPIPLIQTLTLSVQVEGTPVSVVSVDFAGVDMDMGFNRFLLQARGAGQFNGTGMLPICTRSRMTWEARVLLQHEGKILIFPFRFDTLGR